MCMSKSERTQVLLTPAQRTKAERIAHEEGKSIGAVLRDALDSYQTGGGQDERRAAIDALVSMAAPVQDWAVIKADLVATRFHRDRDGVG
jgi:hypothetical protein